MRSPGIFALVFLSIPVAAQVQFPTAPVDIPGCSLPNSIPQGSLLAQTKSGTITVFGFPQKNSFIKETLIQQQVTTAPTAINFTIEGTRLSYGLNRTSIAFQQSGSSAIAAVVTISVSCTPTTTLLIVPPLVTLALPEGTPAGTIAVRLSSNANANNPGNSVRFNMLRDVPWSDRQWLTATSVNGSPNDTGVMNIGQSADMVVNFDPGGLPTQSAPYIGFVHVRDAVSGIGAADLEVDLSITPGPLRPGISNNGIKSAASGATVISPGSWATIYGASLAPDTIANGRSWAAADFDAVKPFLPTSLDNVRIYVGGVPAAIAYVRNDQVNFQVPDVAAGAAVPVVITTSKGTSLGAAVSVQPYAPGLFPLPGTNYPAAQHLNYSYVGTASGFTPATSGETLILWGTGFGPAAIPAPAGLPVAAPVKLANPVTVTVNGENAKRVDAFLVQAGLVQLNVTLPDGLPAGDRALAISVNGIPLQNNNLLLPIR